MKYLYAIITWLVFVGWLSIYLFAEWRPSEILEALIYWGVVIVLAGNLSMINDKEGSK